MNIKGLVIGAAFISVIALGGCASNAKANEETITPTTIPPTTTLAPTSTTGPTAWPVLAAYKDCANCHGFVPDKPPPGNHYNVDGD